ncbi:MAG: PAS domain S-box protein [Cryomorphaceae bacterium]
MKKVILISGSSANTQAGSVALDVLRSHVDVEVEDCTSPREISQTGNCSGIVLTSIPSEEISDLTRETRNQHPHTPLLVLVHALPDALLLELVKAGADDVFLIDDVSADVIRRRLLVLNEKKSERNILSMDDARKQLEGILTHANMGLALTDEKGRFLYTNQGLADLLGYDLSEMTSIGIPDVETPEAFLQEQTLIEEAMRNKRDAYRIEQQLMKKDGTPIWVDLSVTVLRDEKGKLKNLIGAIVDITERKQVQAALMQSEKELKASADRFRNLIEHSTDVIAVEDLDSHIKYVSPSLFTVLGYTEAEVRNGNAEDYVHPDDVEKRKHHLDLLLTGEVPLVQFKERLLRKDGSYIWVLATFSDQRNVPGVEGLVLNFKNIDSEERTAQALRDSYERYELVTRATSDVIWDYDLTTYEISHTDTFEKVFGHALSDMKRTDWESYVHPEDLSYVRNLLQTTLSDPSKDQWKAQYRFIKSDGNYAWVSDNATILRSQDGTALRMIGAMGDITERIEYEQSIEEQNAKLKDIAWMQSHMVRSPLANLMALIELLNGAEKDEKEQLLTLVMQSADELDQVIRNIVKNAERFERKEGATAITRYGFLGEELNELYLHPALLDLATRAYSITNKKDEIVYANQAFLKMTGYEHEFVLGKSYTKLLVGESTDKITLAYMAQREAARQPYEAEVFCYKADKTAFWIRITAQPFISKQGTFNGYFYTKKDISKEKEAEATIIDKTETLAKINNELKNFTYTVSHDLKEPVNSLKALMNLLLTQAGQKLDYEEKEYITRAMSSIERITSMVKALLEYSRSSNMTEQLKEVDFASVVADVRDALESQIQESGAEIKLEGENETMMVFPLQFSRILQNLVNNSLKFRSKKKPEITIQISSLATHWKISVTDNGIGIDEEDLSRVFDLFYYKSKVDQADSHGIGLAVVKRFVEQHEGEIRVDSDFGKGTTFTFTVRKGL